MDNPISTTLSLFSGIGGLDIGWELATGSSVVGYCEREAYAASILLARMEDEAVDPAPIWCGDVTELPLATFRGVDAIIGGFPCQDISQAGKGAGIDGERSGLWGRAFVPIIRELRPRVVFLENVRALVNRGLDTVLSDLADLGYDAEWCCLRASAVGAPHRRDRIFILAHAGSQPIRGVGGISSEAQSSDVGRRSQDGDGTERVCGAMAHTAELRFHRHSAQSRSAGESDDERRLCESTRTSDAMADATGDRRTERRTEPAREQRRPDVAECIGAMAHANGGRGRQAHGEGETKHDHEGSAAMADTDIRRQQSERIGSVCDDADASARNDVDRRDGTPAVMGNSTNDHGRRRVSETETGIGPGGIGRRRSSVAESELGDAIGERLEGKQQAGPTSGPAFRADRAIFAPGPGDLDRWRSILADSPHLAPAVESGVRSVGHGPAVVVDASRADQLRCIGNGVVPLQAAVAARHLLSRIGAYER